ncbi:NAD(P) transhydrogenase subunit beta [Myxococcaceae bacterium]|nr:NAD(P) transhydrogenase subunit beta [Myxococcaceae bacterium]
MRDGIDVQAFVGLAYLLGSVLFIYALKGLSHPRTAVRANLLGAAGMAIAILATLALGIDVWTLVVLGALIGTVAGAVLALRIEMTAMPQMVALLNGFGGLASVLVAGAYLIGAPSDDLQTNVATAASALIGAVTFLGSLVAFAKLQELVSGNPVLFFGRHVVNASLAILAIVLAVLLVRDPSQTGWYWALAVVGSLLGVLLTIPIGGADMPVVIALLNSYSGIAASATGFVLKNDMLIIAGSLVGASGVILTAIMCRAMNRSLANVIFAGVGAAPTSSTSADEVYAGRIKATTAEEIAMVLDGARRIVIVPGYGLAVAQAQHAVKALASLLESRGTVVEYAIHPVAGRMPGHMNVLLAEANVEYDRLRDMDEINPTMEQADAVIVIGANDVVNPSARTDPSSPIAGMPIIDVDKARTVIMIKRSLSPGFAGIPNPLFAADNCLMFFSDGRQAVQAIVNAVREAA